MPHFVQNNALLGNLLPSLFENFPLLIIKRIKGNAIYDIAVKSNANNISIKTLPVINIKEN